MKGSGGPRRSRGEIERLPSGSLRVRVYAGLDPVSKKRRYLTETVPGGPEAEADAERARIRLLGEVAERRALRVREVSDPRHGPGGAGLRAGSSGIDLPAPNVSDAAVGREGRRGQSTVAAIARLAGVSAPTVSKVLNGRAGVAPETRRLVERLLREQGYRRPEKVVRTAVVEVVFYGMHGHLAVEILRGVKQVVAGRGLTVAFTDARQEESTGRNWARALLARRPAGVIVAHMGFSPEQHGLLAASGIPLVAIDPTSEPLQTVPSVAAANRHGGLSAAQHLLDLGHRRIAVITGPLERRCARDRLEGVDAAMEAAGVPLDERLVRTGMWFSFEEGLSHAREILSLAAPPTAVLCGNDLQAFGVYEAARQAGARIPEDLSVVGFDDISYSRWCGPPLTTVHQPFSELGAAAAALVLDLAGGESAAQTRIELATTLVVRASTARPNGR
ncbi:LacI family DNA-binding transcriptional regulator [Glycomyces dulcitolivorans]|uniref:LacI family DNA-binding transcriptional regulator n=1 Tax=Glycomyces dulcitolivorans TaxID=2200759 RepID=UPI000DD357CE|nr:LacI family DNA-binding transcriptional regulator [Glycomyces dulcitolivorans]